MSMTEKDLAEDYRMVLHEAKSMGCNEIKALYNIQLKNMEMIVQALEKQIAKPVEVYSDGDADGYPVWEEHCPCCGYDFDGIISNFCPDCGQRILFEEVEE